MKVFIAPPDESDWTLPLAEFASRLRERWPEASVHLSEDTRRSDALEFELPMASYRLRARFSRDGRAVVIDYGDLRDCIQVAVWFRSLVPATQPLVLCDEGGNLYAPVDAGTTEEALLAALERGS